MLLCRTAIKGGDDGYKVDGSFMMATRMRWREVVQDNFFWNIVSVFSMEVDFRYFMHHLLCYYINFSNYYP
jgi:hypothetical protein